MTGVSVAARGNSPRGMWFIFCSASLQTQNVESMTLFHFRCARMLLWPVLSLKTVVYSCLARRLIGSVEGLQFPVALLHWDFCCGAGLQLACRLLQSGVLTFLLRDLSFF